MTVGEPQPGALRGAIASFVGREREMEQVRSLLATSRLVTLCGAGGVGKTRLATHVGEQLHDRFGDEVWLVDLYGLTDQAAVADHVAMALGIAGESSRTAGEALATALADRDALLILDNCEHLLNGCAELIDELLPAAPGLTVLATSRQALGLTAEHTLPVLPLEVPEPTASMTTRNLAEYGAVRLFLERARSVVPEFELNEENAAEVVSLCARLDGLPLAIELAAVRLRSMSLDQILERLDRRYQLLTGGSRTAEPRQRTLRALIDWSFDLCSEEEQRLWARLSVFAGSLELEAAEEVGADAEASAEVADLVAGLVEKSVLQREEHHGVVRYRLLETIAEYGRERLGEGEGEVRRRHRDYYMRWAERAEGEWLDSWRTRWWERARAEQPNFRAALEFCLANPEEIGIGTRTAAALAKPWRALGLLGEGRMWLDRLLAIDVEPSPARAKALWADAWLAILQGDFDQADGMLDESEAVGKAVGDAAVAAHVDDIRGLGALMRGELARAQELLERAVAGFPPEEWVSGTLALHRLAQTALALGDYERTRDLTAECIARGKGRASWPGIYAQWTLGVATWRLGDAEEAVRIEREAMGTAVSYGDRLGVTLSAQALAWIAAETGRARRSARLLGAIDRTWRDTGANFAEQAHMSSFQDECVERLTAALGRSQFESQFAQGGQFGQDEMVAEALEQESSGDRDSLLTAREWEIAKLVSQGMTNPEIAGELVISPRTAETHVQHILTKLGFSSRTQIAVWVAELPADEAG